MGICAATGCTEQVSAEFLMCRNHWFRVPQDIRNKVFQTWRRARRDPEAYQEARSEAIAAAAAYTPRPKPAPPEPKQGSLL